MAVVKINAISVSAGAEDELEARFRRRVGEVESMDGFLGFELLKPTSGESRYFVYTRWESEEAFQGWFNSQAFQRGHAQSAEPHQGGPVSHGAELLEFEVVLAAEPASDAP